MIHGVYLKSRPKSTWRLVSVALSVEGAKKHLNKLLNQAYADGNENAEGTIQAFSSAFNIPEILHEVKDQKLLYN